MSKCLWTPKCLLLKGYNSLYKKVRLEKKGRFRSITGHKGPDGQYTYSSTLSLKLALDWNGWLTPDLGCLIPGKDTKYPLYRSQGGSSGMSGRLGKILPSPELEPRTVQTVSSHYTD